MIDPSLLSMVLKRYLITVSVETPVLCLMLSRQHPMKRRIFAGIWLTTCSYPVIALILPPLFDPEQYLQYVITAEIFAPASECFLFWFAYLRKTSGHGEADGQPSIRKDMIAIVVANALSCGLGFLLMWLKIRIS